MPEQAIDADLLAILACPADHHAPVRQQGDQLVCTECGLRFPIRGGIPVMLLDQALPGLSPTSPKDGS